MDGRIRRIAARILIVALVLGSVTLGATRAARADDVHISSVDNYGGKSNVVTDKPNTLVIVTSLDADGKKVDQWSGTTDANGRLTIAAGYNLSREYLRASTPSGNYVEGMVLPESIADRQPFTFAVTGAVDGEVIDVKTVDGQVVASRHADSLGRVFLPAGLAAGAYLVSTAGHGQADGRIEIQPGSPGAAGAGSGYVPRLRWRIAYPGSPGGAGVDPLRGDMPGMIDQNQPLRLSGEGFNPDAAHNVVRLGSGDGQLAPILAATTTEIRLAPPADAAPGPTLLRVANTATGEAESAPVYVYGLQGRLERRTIVRPQSNQTHLLLAAQPDDQPMKVHVMVTGPVNLGDGRKDADITVVGGKADIPLVADPGGAGRFHVSYALAEPPAASPPAATPGYSDDEIRRAMDSGDTVPWSTASAMRDQVMAGSATGIAGGIVRKAFLDWWKDYLEAMCAYEMLDGWITSPNHWPLKDDEVRGQARNQVTALTDGAKKKLIQRLKDRAKALRDKAKGLRAAGQDQKAQMAEDQAGAMDAAANEVSGTLSPGKG